MIFVVIFSIYSINIYLFNNLYFECYDWCLLINFVVLLKLGLILVFLYFMFNIIFYIVNKNNSSIYDYECI